MAIALILLLITVFAVYRVMTPSSSQEVPASETTDGTADPDDSPDSSQPDVPQVSGELDGGGAANAVSAMEGWSLALEEAGSLKLGYNPVGNNMGLEEFLKGDRQYAITTRPMDETEANSADGCEAPPLHLPVLADPVALAVNVPEVEDLVLDAKTLAAIYQGEITSWNDPAIAELNPEAELPDLKITPVYRSDRTPVNRAMTEWLQASGAWSLAAGDDWPAKGGTPATASETRRQLETAGAIAYLPASAAVRDTQVALVRHGGKDLSAHGPEGAYQIDGSPKVPGRPEHDQARQLDRNIDGAYPAVVVSYVVVCGKYPDAADGERVREVFGWILSPEGHRLAVDEKLTSAFSEGLYGELASAIESIG
ncbi:substrate-binding domain-containing protein [Enemella sp. A6]|uniref:substrate-binding domain-containing protein n=1 Tax=Enemella sp. A6 TaxID=3440152 RepID=UPI003EBB310A